jgi:secondary thiamine-phosphate synthase enzyme
MTELVTIDVRSTRREELIDITSQVRSAVKRSGVTSGLACVFCPHTTAAVTIQENADPDVRSDMIAHLARSVPQDPRFKHSEGNADAHIKSSLVGASVTVIVDEGKPVLGTWQAVFFCEFDGPRDRRVLLKVLGNRKGGADV